MRWADGKAYTAKQDAANLLEAYKDASNLSPRAARTALLRATKYVYDAVGTEEHDHWCNVRAEVARIVEQLSNV